MTRQRIVFYADSDLRASQFRNLLASYGIDATIEQDSGSDRSSTNESACPRVLVAEQDYEFAYELATDFDTAKTASAPAHRNPTREATDRDARDPRRERSNRNELQADFADDDAWPERPRCPQCRRRREAVCPSCGNRDAQAPVAQSPDSLSLQDLAESLASEGDEWRDGEGDPVPLVCRVCDAAFAARFDGHCRHCGFHFQDGVDSPPVKTLNDFLNYRTLFVAALVIALLIAIWVFLMTPLHEG